MALKDRLAVDMHTTFLSLNEFAEEITYIPSGGSPRLIKAIIDRQRIVPAAESQGRSLNKDVEIMIANSDDYGVASVAKGKDICYFPKVLGQSNATFVVADIIFHDAGMWHLLVRE